MTKDQPIHAIIIEESTALTLEEFCYALHTEKNVVIEMVEYQLLKPRGATPEQWRFDSVSLKRGKTAASFYHELEVNMPGVALALDLLDQIEELKRRLS